jgi:hypothetical protein
MIYSTSTNPLIEAVLHITNALKMLHGKKDFVSVTPTALWT